jgi:hypothetical protein
LPPKRFIARFDTRNQSSNLSIFKRTNNLQSTNRCASIDPYRFEIFPDPSINNREEYDEKGDDDDDDDDDDEMMHDWSEHDEEEEEREVGEEVEVEVEVEVERVMIIGDDDDDDNMVDRWEAGSGQG